ncbi:hypothetical protein E2320_003722 [Naja naja]|nr:hypothetical protein E2320_003722 [Naja naja]
MLPLLVSCNQTRVWSSSRQTSGKQSTPQAPNAHTGELQERFSIVLSLTQAARQIRAAQLGCAESAVWDSATWKAGKLAGPHGRQLGWD